MTVIITNQPALHSAGLISVAELDGSPSVSNIGTLKLTNNTVTDNGDGSVSISVGTGVGNGDVLGPITSIDGEVTLFSGTSGKVLRRSTLTGIVKAIAGVQTVANPGTDYLLPTGDGSGLTAMVKSQVGLSNVDNTSDVNKPISTATQTALDLKANSVSPSFTGGLSIQLQPTENVIIDARTYPRTSSTSGVLRINHTAGKTGTRPISIDVDCAGFADTHAVSVNYVATGLIEGVENHGFDFNVDTDNSTGGDLAAVCVTKTGIGLLDVSAIDTYPGVHVVNQQVGSSITADSNFIYSGGAFSSATAEFDSSGINSQIFVANTDYIYIGHATKFNLIDVAFNIVTSGAGIIPTFEYSRSGGGGWATFSPGDTTNGFRQNGVLSIPALTLWTATTVNGVTAKYWIRIRRTNAAPITPPTESAIKIYITASYGWDNSGNVNISRINVANLGVFSNNAAAIAGGLVIGDIYRTSGGTLNVVV